MEDFEKYAKDKYYIVFPIIGFILGVILCFVIGGEGFKDYVTNIGAGVIMITVVGYRWSKGGGWAEIFKRND